MKIGMISLGCSKNLVDSEMVLGLVSEAGMEIVTDPKKADIIIINTCGFIESAKQEAIDTILEMAEYKTEGKKLVVMGCLAERYLKELKSELPEVDRFITLKEYDKIGSILKELVSGFSFGEGLQFFNRVLATPKHLAYVKIAEGCDNRCAYCAIPLIRGSFRSRKMSDIIKEVNGLVQKGVKEIVLISQDTSRYGRDFNDGTTLSELLNELVKIEGLNFLRFLYLYPDLVTDELIDVVKRNPKITPYFDIPIQHASNKILKLMGRRGSKELLIELFDKIKRNIPEAVLRTTLIVGFPGEDDEDFTELKEFIEVVRFNHLGAFAYSKEEDTRAYNFDNQIVNEVKQERLDIIMKLQQKISYHKNKEQIGTTVQVIIDDYDKKLRMYKARSYYFAPDAVDGYIYISTNNDLNIGDIYNVEITDAVIYGVIGKLKQ